MDKQEIKKLENLTARYKRQNEAIKGKYDRASITLPKGTKDKIRELANESCNSFITRLVMQEIERLEATQSEENKEVDKILAEQNKPLRIDMNNQEEINRAVEQMTAEERNRKELLRMQEILRGKKNEEEQREDYSDKALE